MIINGGRIGVIEETGNKRDGVWCFVYIRERSWFIKDYDIGVRF